MKRCIFLMIATSILALSCQKQETQEGSKKSDIPERHIAIISSYGFDTSTIENKDTYYLVEGDIMFDKTDLNNWCGELTRQQSHERRVTWADMMSIYIDNSVPNSWRDAIYSAIEEWNNIDNCRISFKIVTTIFQAQTVIFHDGALRSDIVAQASWPNSNGDPGPIIRINSYNFDFFSFAQKKFTMAHELGHIIGFMHFEDGSHIGGTPVKDNNSIMRAATGGVSWVGFSDGDKAAARIMYPPRFNHQYLSPKGDYYHICDFCGWIYDSGEYYDYPGGRIHHLYYSNIPYPAYLVNNGNIAHGTDFNNLPDYFVCVVCGGGKDDFSPWRPFCRWRYDQLTGDPINGILPGTLWEDIPLGWQCPWCCSQKSLYAFCHPTAD